MKFKIAVFLSEVFLLNKKSQKALTIVAETSATKKFAGVTVCFDKQFNEMKILTSTDSIVGEGNDEEFFKILRQVVCCLKTTKQDPDLSKQIDKICLLKKIDLFCLDEKKNKYFSLPYSLNDSDTNGQKLIDFLRFNYEFLDNDIQDFNFSSLNLIRKFAVAKKKRDFSAFWNSQFITPAEKDYCRAKIDLDICMSNSNKDMFKVLTRTLFVDYPERNWVFNILFGDPSSGKTTMVENLCALHNIPFVKLTGDPTVTLSKLIMTVGPENVQRNLTQKDFNDKLKALGFTDAEINSYKDKIAEVILSSKDVDVQLTEQYSILLKCIIHKLPLLVLLDEVNLNTTIFMATLADVITSGYVNVGVHTYKDDGHNILWFGAYNPNTYKFSPFENKFRDRALFFCSEMPTQEQLISHKQRKILSSLFGCDDVTAEIKEEMDSLCEQYPGHAKEFNGVFNLIENFAKTSTPSGEAVQWFFNYKKEEILKEVKPSFKENEFSDYYIGDCQLDSPSNISEGIKRILILKDKINDKLKILTKGIDSKNPDKDFYFYIPNRSIDYLIDLIFCFSSVRKGIEFFVYNLIPNGGTIKFNNSENPAKDISQSIIVSLENEIDELQLFLFNSVDKTIMSDDSYSLYCEAIFDINNFDVVNGGVNNVDQKVEDVFNSSVSTDELLDEAEDLLK